MASVLLQERFHVSVRVEQRQADIFFLVRFAGNNRPAVLKRTAVDCSMSLPPPSPDGGRPQPCDALRVRGGAQPQLDGAALTMTALAGQLSAIPAIGRPVIDQTGLTERYDVTLKWAPPLAAGDPPVGDPAFENLPSIFAALQEQLGLELKPGHGSIDVLLIENAERPRPN